MTIASGKRLVQFTLALAFGVALINAAPASADLVTVVTDTTWTQSTVTEVNNTFPGWPGVAALPADGTFTVATVAIGGTAVPGTTRLAASSGVRFYRDTFVLPAFSTLTVDLQLLVDNDVHVFINDAALALEGSLTVSNFANPPHRLTIDATGDVINGALGGEAFDSVTDPFSPANWIAGTNEVILAVRNLFPGDSGGISFRMDITTTDPVQVPVPGTVVLLVSALAGVGVLHRRRQRP